MQKLNQTTSECRLVNLQPSVTYVVNTVSYQ